MTDDSATANQGTGQRRLRRPSGTLTFGEGGVRDLVATTVTAVILGGWIVDRIRTGRVLADERQRHWTHLAGLYEKHRRDLTAVDRRRQADIAEALTDPTTGLPTRRAWEATASARLRSPAELALLDLDRFKQINDTFGHVVGDQLLYLVSSRLRETLGPDAVLGRAGGDEIVIVTRPGINWGQVIAAITAEIPLPCGTALQIGVSVGVARTHELGIAPTLMRALDVADEAMYKAKRSGGGWERATSPRRSLARTPQTA